MDPDRDQRWWELGFGYEDVIDAWQDDRLARAIELAWNAARRPSDVDVWWISSGDEYAFRWFLNPAAARLLDEAAVEWRRFVIGRVSRIPPTAHSYLDQISA
jgi:hypothetical protein